ncbi:MAG TPA: Na+/H+ antiporter NhaA [Rubrobacteraceae bacterium]|jgi:NhaA family Na+:H+ antiporter|nr:Na+/H+ antiporter NhaA [Rubrobacteraceae bacterium]
MQSKTIKRLFSPFEEFVHSESAGGLSLIAAAIVAFIWANSPWAPGYFALREISFGIGFGDFSLEKPLLLWVNDGLMAFFFFLVGLEIKREILVGELSSPRDAFLAVAAALGGMVVPAAIYAAVNWGGEGINGWGIPMATDIAFALGMMALLGNRVPLSLKVFLTALAIVDDLGAVLVIALFYTEEINALNLLVALGALGLAFAYGRLGGRNLKVLAFFGVVVWFFVLQSGIHATVAGVLLALATPMKRKIAPENLRDELRAGLEHGEFEEVEVKVANLERVLGNAQSPLHRLEHLLHPWVAFLVLPIFALLNAGVDLGGGGGALTEPVALGVVLGLLLGKPLGVLAFSWLAMKLGLASLPEGVDWGAMVGAGLLAGIGFTMSLFVGGLAFEGSDELLDQAKIGILAASVVAAVLGLILLGRRAPSVDSE